MTTAEKRTEALRGLKDMDSKKVANHFIEIVSWNKLIEAYNDLKNK